MVLAAIVLALGVNLLASGVSGYLGSKTGIMVLIGVALTLLSIYLISRRTLSSRSATREFEGFVCFRSGTADLIAVPRYRYAEELESYLEALFAENDAPKKLWESDPVDKGFEFNHATRTSTKRTTHSGKLLIEATEYFILEILSTHLTDYFNQSNFDASRLRELAREDVAPIVFSNRFLDTFSRPMRERAGFVDQTLGGGNNLHEHIIAAYGDGLRFTKFDLILPSGATVARVSDGEVLIRAPKFNMNLRTRFDGYGSNLPAAFEELYLGSEKFTDISTYKVNITVSVEFKFLALFTRSGWDYHRWLDSFLMRLEKDFSRHAFLRKINWDTALTVARVFERSIARRRESSADKSAE
ncbi:hypothetical protein QZM46_23580 [Burkholderia vietnamiensis]|uniref:hypothetical protein n=1 Tax=Burkholderia vietnamiensis TaxID=60552 RepID=UPI002653DA8A|nr:hypothetical protein [Burkholderia vietnamiensis]MDN7554300.1 hypothetical protein [Burkholderia vietnamiensis]HDR9096502.1 hypothetical protein [Burkholderia vietnamiensis]